MDDTTEKSTTSAFISIIIYSGIVYLYGFYHGYYFRNESTLRKVDELIANKK